MDSLLARYFDGDLSESEARELIAAVERNRELEKELHAYERVLAAARALPSPRAPARFTEGVMKDITAEGRRERSALRSLFAPAQWVPHAGWAGAAMAAAVMAIAFLGGWWIGRGRGVEPVFTPEARTAVETTSPRAESGVSAGPAAMSGLRYVRLVYAPADAAVRNVGVAGSFNDWNPAATPLRRQDGVWSTILLLPPGNHEYMFVENGERWVTDPLAAQTRDDGFGTMNAVLDVEF